jgi:hypothetical protein
MTKIALADMLGARIDVDAFELGEIPGAKFSGVDFSFEYLDDFTDILDEINEIKLDVKDLFESGIECAEYKSYSINLIEYMAEGFGVNPEELGIAACPFSFRMCTSLVVPGFDDFKTKVSASQWSDNIVLGGANKMILNPVNYFWRTRWMTV